MIAATTPPPMEPPDEEFDGWETYLVARERNSGIGAMILV